MNLSLHRAAEFCIRPIDYTVEQSIRSFMTAVTPGKFGNCNSYLREVSCRIMSVACGILLFPISLALYGTGLVLDKTGDLLEDKPYRYLKGAAEEKRGLLEKNGISFFSANLCMLPYGIPALGGVSPPFHRIGHAAEMILAEDKDFVCLQEMSFIPSLSLWEKIKGSYAHGFTRIGPMPVNRMGTGLFFASKYPVEEVQYRSLTDDGPIVRGVFCAKTKKGWIINGHLSTRSPQLRKQQMQEITDICKDLSQEGKVPCFVCIDSNIARTGKANDEYANVAFEKDFINGFEHPEPFVLTSENATCTNLLQAAVRKKKDPERVEEAFEHVDYILSYKSSAPAGRIKTRLIQGYDLQNRENAVSDHHALCAEVVFDS